MLEPRPGSAAADRDPQIAVARLPRGDPQQGERGPTDDDRVEHEADPREVHVEVDQGAGRIPMGIIITDTTLHATATMQRSPRIT